MNEILEGMKKNTQAMLDVLRAMSNTGETVLELSLKDNLRLIEALEKCVEQRDEELDDNCYEPERPFVDVKSEFDQQLTQILKGGQP